MKTITYTNESGDVMVELLTDLIGDNDMLTIYQATGLDDEDETFGFDFDIPGEYTLKELETFATDKNLTMTINEEGEDAISKNTYTALDVTTTSLPNGVASGAAQVETITLPATSAATQADYILLSNYKGETLAAWLDIDGAGTPPTGDKYVAADYTAKVSIVTGGTAIENGTIFADAIDSAPDWPAAVSIVDNGDGTVTITQNLAGACDNADPENANDTGVGSITAVVDTAGSGTAYLDTGEPVQLEYEGGNAPITWTAATLPAGLSISADGIISGVPTAGIGTTTVTFTVTDFYDVTATADLDITLA